jgi:hypothetical protein
MDFVGKMIRGPPNRPSRNMITACCDHKCCVGRPQTTGKNFMVKNLRLLFQDVTTVQINQYSSVQSWIHKASSKKYWCHLVDRLLHPSMPLPDRPNNWGPLSSWQACHATAGCPPTNDSPNSDNETFEDNEEDKPSAPPTIPPTTSTSPPPTTMSPAPWQNQNQ